MGATAPVWNLANGVTLARIALVPLVVLALVADGGRDGGWRWVAALAFGLAAATDRLDGWIARRYDMVTDWGKLVDPIADKLLVGSSLVMLSILGDLPWWVTAVVLAREALITLMRLAVLRYVVIPASPGGKLKTVLQSVAISLFLLPLEQLPSVVTVLAWVVMGAAVLTTVVTGVDYLRRGWQVRRAVVRHEAVPGGRGPSAEGTPGPGAPDR